MNLKGLFGHQDFHWILINSKRFWHSGHRTQELRVLHARGTSFLLDRVSGMAEPHPNWLPPSPSPSQGTWGKLCPNPLNQLSHPLCPKTTQRLLVLWEKWTSTKSGKWEPRQTTEEQGGQFLRRMPPCHCAGVQRGTKVTLGPLGKAGSQQGRALPNLCSEGGSEGTLAHRPTDLSTHGFRRPPSG